MEEEIVRVNRIIIAKVMTREGERKFALRYLLDPKDNKGVLVIPHLITEERLHELASAFHKAVEHIDNAPAD